MSLLSFKIVAVFLIFFTGLIGGNFSFKLAESNNSKRWFSLGNSFAAGTFLYVSILGIAHEEFSEPTDKLLKFICMGIGLAVMGIVAIWT